ncbi:MAG: TlpA disulfide reductase family protein [Pyrinomonadaceae bacterium]
MFVLLTALTAVYAYSQSNLRPGSPAPAFTGTRVDGSTVSLDEMRGKVVVITFWTTRCVICRIEMPQLDRVMGQYDPKKIAFLALTTENQRQVAGYLRNNPMSFQIVPDSFGTLLKYADRDRAGNIDMGYPSFFVVDQRGLVQYRASGYDKTVAIDQAVSRLMSE